MIRPAVGTALVTGASRGVGLEVSRLLTSHGVRVVMLARSGAALETAASELGELATPVVCDVANAADVAAMAAHVREVFDGPPDVIVNNAGRFTLAAVESTSPGDFRAALEVNLMAPFLIVHAFVAAMRARKSGHILTIGSIADRMTFPENGAYAASKFGLRALHEVLRGEMRGSGVRATLVSPAAINTSLWDDFEPDARPGFTPRRLMLSAEAVAEAVWFALSQPADVNIDELRLSHS